MSDIAFRHLARALIAATWFATCGLASAATLVLKDGTVIVGEIRTLQNDMYTVNTTTLGTVRISKHDVRTIDHSNASAESSAGRAQGSLTGGALRSGPDRNASPRSSSDQPAGPSSNALVSSQADLEAMQSRMLQNPNIFGMIQGLQNDPQMQAILADPEIMNAIASGNFAVLMNHPKIIALTQNPQVRDVIEAAQ